MKIIGAAATTLQLLATALLGLMAGFFFALLVEVVPAVLGHDARNYVDTQQAIIGVAHGLPFALVYFGAVLMPPMAALMLWICGRPAQAQPWFIIGIVYLIGVFLLTTEISVPVTAALAQWDSQSIPATWMRDHDQWARANLLRCITACVSFAGALAALAWPRRPG
jgi:uncharacterized membrane protein